MFNNKYIDKNGYPRFKGSNVPVHRYVAKKKIGRELEPGEVVHHINRKKIDNRQSNLWVCKSQKQHDRIHKIDAHRYGRKISYSGF